MLTPSQHKALDILRNTSFGKGMSARAFAKFMWPDSLMHSRISNQGNGATRGKAAWLCGGSYLRKLEKLGLVKYWDSYYISDKGKSELNHIVST